jgi:hypothetical protein
MSTDEVERVRSELRLHEIQCEERWKTNFQRLESIEEQLLRFENRMMAMSGALILFLGGVIVTLVTMLG